MGKKEKGRKGVVYSTDPDFSYNEGGNQQDETLAPEEQRLTVRIDRKQRKGKEVTLVEGFVGNESDLKDLGKQLKTSCGTGGSVKEGQIIIQGDFRKRLVELLQQKGYKAKAGN